MTPNWAKVGRASRAANASGSPLRGRLLFDPAILILDEATASVDAELERTICEAIRRWAGQRTTILIAHRLLTLQDADRLFVFDQGRLAEQGRPEDLIRAQGSTRNSHGSSGIVVARGGKKKR